MFEPLVLDIVPPALTVNVTGRESGTVLLVSTSHVPTSGAQDDALAVPMAPATTAPTTSTARDIVFLNILPSCSVFLTLPTLGDCDATFQGTAAARSASVNSYGRTTNPKSALPTVSLATPVTPSSRRFSRSIS